MADKTSNVLLKYTVDRASSQGALNSVRLLQEELGKTAKRELGVAQAADEMNQALAKLARQKALDIVAEDAAKAIQQGKALNQVLEDTATVLSLVGASEDELRGVVAQLERINTLEERTSSQSGLERGKRIGDLGSLASAAGGLNLLGGAGGVLGEVGQIGDIVQYTSQVSENIGQLAASLGTSTTGLIGAFGATGLAVGATILVLGQYNKGLDEHRNKLIAAFNAQKAYYDALGILTEEQVREQIKANEKQLEIERSRLAETNQSVEMAFDGLRRTVGRGVPELLPEDIQRTLLRPFGGSALAEQERQLEEQQKTVSELEATNVRLTQGLEAGKFAANNTAEAELELAKIREDAANRALNAQLNTLLQADTMTSEQAQKRIAAIQKEVDASESFIASGTLTEDQVAQLRNRISDLGVESQTLQQQVLPLIEAREREAAAIQAQLTAIDQQVQGQIQLAALVRDGSIEQIRARQEQIAVERAAIEAQLPALEALAAESEAGQDKLDQYRGRMADLNREASNLNLATPIAALRAFQDTANKLADAQTNLNDDLGKLANSRDARLGELADNLSRGLTSLGDDLRAQQEKQQAGDLDELRKFHDAEEDRVKQHRFALAQIERQYDNSRKDALQDRGAVELDRAERTRDEAVKNENEKFDAESEKRRKDLEDLKRSQAAERRELITNYQKRYNDLIQQNQREVAVTMAKYNADVSARQQAFQQQQTQLQNALSAELGIRQTAYNGLLAQAAAWASKMAGLTTGGGNNTTLGNIASSVFNVGKSLLGFAGGGSAPANQPVRINERGLESGMNARGDLAIFSNPMRIFNAQQTRQMMQGGGLNVPITVNGVGLSRAQVIGEVVRQLDSHLTAAGVA